MRTHTHIHAKVLWIAALDIRTYICINTYIFTHKCVYTHAHTHTHTLKGAMDSSTRGRLQPIAVAVYIYAYIHTLYVNTHK